MDALRQPAATHDLSALAWVQEEMRKTFESAHKALRRHLREAEATSFGEVDDVEPAILRHARQQLHAGAGALELVNLPEGAMLVRAAESLVQRFVAKPQRVDQPGVEAIEAASFALLDYLGRRIAGKPTDPVGLFPQLHALNDRLGAERSHPADLWPHDWRWCAIRPVVKIDPLQPTAGLAEFERLLLAWVKQNRGDIARGLRNVCAGLGQRDASTEEQTLWRLGAGFFDAISVGVLGPDTVVKRTASRLMQHLRALVRAGGEPAVAERLAQDLLFFNACVPANGPRAAFVAAVREAYDLPAEAPPDYNQVHYGRVDPALISQARKRVESAKQAWSGVAGEEPHRISQLVENFTLVGESVRKLYRRGERLALSLQNAAERTVQRGQLDSAELAMEVATSLLYLEASLDERDFDQPDQDAQIERLAERLDRVVAGQAAEPLEAWIEQLYRRVSDRQTMSSVVQELRVSLSEVERQIDQFFRNPRENGLLVPVPVQLKSMHGVLALLGIEQSCLAIDRMCDDVDNLVQDQVDSFSPEALPAFHRLAGNLGALGFLIDTLAVQPAMAASFFVFDQASGILAPVSGRTAMAPELLDRVQAIADAARREEMPLAALSDELAALSRQPQISKQPALAASLSSARDAIGQAHAAGAGPHTEDAVREHVAQAMDDFVATATNPVGLDPLGPPLISRPMDLEPAPAEPTGLEGDSEMRAIFLEESREVLGEARIALAELARTPADVSQITTVRRAFHTLKGSARMVGLAPVAEAAWAYEQLYNRWLADQAPASGELRMVTGDALHYLGAWVEAIAERDDDAFLPEPLVAAADTLRLAGELMRVPTPQRHGAVPVAPVSLREDLMPAGDEAADAAPGEATPSALVDFEVPLDEPQSGVFQQLQATQPLDLAQTEAMAHWDRTAPLDLDLGTHAGAASDLDLDLDFSAPAAAPAAALSAEAPEVPEAPAWRPEDDMAVVSDLMPEVSELEGMADLGGSGLALDQTQPIDPHARGSAAAPADAVDVPHTIDAQAGADALGVAGDAGGAGGLGSPDGVDFDIPVAEATPADEADAAMTLLDLRLEDAGLHPVGAPLPPAQTPAEPPAAPPARWYASGHDEPVVVGPPYRDSANDALPPQDDPLELIELPEVTISTGEAGATTPNLADQLTAFDRSPALHDLPPIVAPPEQGDAPPPAAAAIAPFGDAAPAPAPAPAMADAAAVPAQAEAHAPVADAAPAATAEPATAAPALPAAPTPESLAEPLVAAAPAQDEYRHIGHLRLKIPLFNIYLNEADELSRRLGTELAEWALELHRPVGDTAVALAHSLAGSSGTVGFEALSRLARELEHALQRSDELGRGEAVDAALFSRAGDEVRHLLHQFAAGFLREAPPDLMQALTDWQHAADQLLLQRLERNSIVDSRLGSTTLSPSLGESGADDHFDPEHMPEQVADTGWQPDIDAPLGQAREAALQAAARQARQALHDDALAAQARGAGAPPAAASIPSAESSVDLPVDGLADPSTTAAAATPAETPPAAPGTPPAEPGADRARPARVVTLADLALPVPDVVEPLDGAALADHFDLPGLGARPPGGPGATGTPVTFGSPADWASDLDFDLPPPEGAAGEAPPRRPSRSDARPTELHFPTIPGTDIDLIVDGHLQPPSAPLPLLPDEPRFAAPPVEQDSGPDIPLDLAAPAVPVSADLHDDERPVAGESALDIDLFEAAAPLEEPYSEPLTQMVDLPGDSGGPGATPRAAGFDLGRDLAVSQPGVTDDADAVEAVDADLFPVFEEEALDLVPVLTQQLDDWRQQPANTSAGTGCMRTLHTFKGGARLAGAMRLGELAHQLETVIERLLGAETVAQSAVDALQPQADQLIAAFESLRSRFNAPRNTTLSGFGGMGPMGSGLSSMVPMAGETRAAPLATRALPFADAGPTTRIHVEPLVPSMPMPLEDEDGGEPLLVEPSVAVAWRASQLGGGEASGRAALPVVPPSVDWASLVSDQPHTHHAVGTSTSTLPVRVRPQLLDRLVNMAGEVSITRARLESEVGQIRGSLADLGDNLERLNQQLRDVTLQAETQLESRMEAARAMSQAFDPLELDRYTRLQELTRMMAESVNDVATVRTALQRTLQTTEDELAMQGRLTRELQGDLLRTRMLEFDSLSERLQRVVRQAAAETGKQVRLDIVGGTIEVDRGVLDRMTPAFEHLLRNCVGHGIEAPDQRLAAGKEALGAIGLTVQQEGNEVSVEVRDDGAGLDLARIRERAVAMGLLAPDATPTDQQLAQFIFTPGLSTAGQVTELAGRGVGMDVVRSDVQALGGRIEIHTEPGRGTRFKLVLPLTTVVTQVVLLRAGSVTIAVPSHLIELVQRATGPSLQQAYASGSYGFGGMAVPFYWLGALLESSGSGAIGGRTRPVVIVRSAQQRVALHVDEVQGNQEVVVKNLGAQLVRLPGLAGLTLLASGGVALIYNPVALATVYGALAQDHTRMALAAPAGGEAGPLAPEVAPPAPLVLVVDDSLTVRRVTKRLLEREGWRVALAKDGLEALEVLGGERPALMLSDIEMPRMDGFDLLRNVRADAKLGGLPVIMITSRIAQKHREHAMQLGASHYLGKPYAEEELLALVKHYTRRGGTGSTPPALAG